MIKHLKTKRRDESADGIPEHLWRFPTSKAIDNLSKRFGLPNSPEMQDWEWEVADPQRIDEFVDAYLSSELDDDERFTLMETIVQSFEDFDGPIEQHPRWKEVLRLLDEKITLHIYTVYYWSDLETENVDEQWRVTKYFRSILYKHKEDFGLKI